MLRRYLAVLPVATFVLTLLLPAFAFGQARAGDDVQYRAVCQNIIGAISVAQSQTGSANAIAVSGGGAEDARGGSARAVAAVAQAQGVSVAQVNECLNDAVAAGERPGVKAAANAAKAQYAKADVIRSSIPKKPLPFTGGIPLLGLFAVIGLAAIVAGVFVLRAVMSRRL